MQIDGDIIGTAIDHGQLVALLRQRKAALQISDTACDHLCELAQGHVQKLLGPSPVKGLGAISLTALLRVLALKLVVMVDDEQVAKISNSWERKSVTRDHPATYSLKQARPLVLARVARKAVRARWDRTSPEQRAAVGAMLVAARKMKRTRTLEAR